MNKRKKAHPTAPTAGQVNKKKMFDRVLLSANDFTIVQCEKQGLIETLLPKGEKNAIPSNELVKLTDFKSVRELQNEIAHEREAGALILSTCRNGGGYFLPSNGEEGQREIAAYVATLKARALNTLKVLKTARVALKKIEGQVMIHDDIEGG